MATELNSNNRFHPPQEPWKSGTECIAQFNFRGSSADDLVVSKGDVITIVKPTKDPMWYLAKRKDGKEGMVPANYFRPQDNPGEVTLHVMPWFHGKISRQQAEELLNPREDGLFLVRESTNFPGDYTLCVSWEGKVEHYHIIIRSNKLTIDEESYFDNLIKLVQHYERDADGLCCQLQRPLQKKGNFEVTVDRQAFIEKGWVIARSDIALGETIGHGEFGDVLKGEYRGQKVAVKSLKDNTHAAQQFLTEASLMTALRHPNLVQLLGVVLGQEVLIVTEFMGKGNLVDYLRSRGRSVISKRDQINFACHTANGMAYLEEKKFVHRDLAARNVLVNDEGIAKVSDFGLARRVDTNQEGGKFPIKWTAPEALREAKFTNKSDMWSFGILLWEIYSFGRVPYPRIPLAEVALHVEKGYRMEAPEACPADIYDMMRQAWDKDPEKRPTFTQICVQLDRIRQNTPA